MSKKNDMILPFKLIFEPKIQAGIKKHSIRQDRHKRWKVGIKIHMATGVRTKQYNCFNDKHSCISTQTISITPLWRYRIHTHYVSIDGRKLTDKEIRQLAINDGFNCVSEFFEWFEHGLNNGTLIHWTDLKY